MGRRRQFLPQAIGSLKPNMKLVGRAMSVLDVFDEDSLGGEPFGLMLEALDDLRANEVYVAAGGSFRYMLWGELMSTRAQYLHAARAVLNGFVRDAAGIEALGFPTFCRVVYAQDQGPRGKVIDFRTPIEIEGVRVAPGDLIFGDREGVIVISARRRERSGGSGPAKSSTESKIATSIRGGMSAREAVRNLRRALTVSAYRLKMQPAMV
jgi:regulator of RNase E activity RraA